MVRVGFEEVIVVEEGARDGGLNGVCVRTKGSSLLVQKVVLKEKAGLHSLCRMVGGPKDAPTVNGVPTLPILEGKDMGFIDRPVSMLRKVVAFRLEGARLIVR
jgi:hypothetical protein